jgi:hypothetical protein
MLHALPTGCLPHKMRNRHDDFGMGWRVGFGRVKMGSVANERAGDFRPDTSSGSERRDSRDCRRLHPGEFGTSDSAAVRADDARDGDGIGFCGG